MTGGRVHERADPYRSMVEIHAVVVAENDGNSLSYHLEPGNKWSEPYVTGPAEITIPNSDALFNIHFRIDDNDCGYNLKFDRSMPICARDGRCCPEAGGIQTGQLQQPDTAMDQWLTISDFNVNEGPIGFALFFKDKDGGADIPPFDPIMQNGGGGSPPQIS